MIDFTIETEIERTPAEVFAYVTDPTKLATWQTNTVSAVPETDGPLRVGSRIREVHRAPGGKKIEKRGTSLRFRVYGQPTGLTRLAEPLLRFIVKRNFQHLCTTLKRVLEDATVKPYTVRTGDGALTDAR